MRLKLDPTNALLCLAVLVSPAVAQEIVLYDTLWIHDNGVMDAGTGNAIGGSNGPTGRTVDSQIAEDVDILEPVKLTRAFYDIMSFNGSVPAEGVWMQIFADQGGRPSETLAADFLVRPSDMKFEEIDTPLEFRAYRLELDLRGAAIELPPDRWWFAFQPLDEVTTGDWFWTIAAVSIPPIGEESYVRDSGPAHGNPYGGIWGTDFWEPHNFRGNAVLSFRLEGELADPCTGNERLKVICAGASCGGAIKAKIKRATPGVDIEFALDGSRKRVETTNSKGRAKTRWCNVATGRHTVDALPCITEVIRCE